MIIFFPFLFWLILFFLLSLFTFLFETICILVFSSFLLLYSFLKIIFRSYQCRGIYCAIDHIRHWRGIILWIVHLPLPSPLPPPFQGNILCISIKSSAFPHHCRGAYSVFPSSLAPFYIITYFLEWGKNFWIFHFISFHCVKDNGHHGTLILFWMIAYDFYSIDKNDQIYGHGKNSSMADWIELNWVTILSKYHNGFILGF